ncbi:MAG: NAD(P)-dependent oxidoreductase [Deltaproteobacteria bacterium]|nr:NAD(P)-dependent oxidoreductase [Deltaproteobacteria bacterium]
MTTLITGSGLIGTSFGEFAAQRGERLVFFDFEPRERFLKDKLGAVDYLSVRGDILDLPCLTQTIQEHKIDKVLHTAAIIAGRVAANPHWAFTVNIQGTINVAEAARLTGVRRVVHVSTLSVYDRRFERTLTVAEDSPRGETTPYGYSKAVQELVLEAYQRQYGFDLLVVRLAHVFGLGHFLGGAASGAITHTLLTSGRRGDVANIDLSQTSPLERIYAKDVGRAVEQAMTVPMPPVTVFNVGTGHVTTFDELVLSVRKIFPALRVEIVEDGSKRAAAKKP